MAALENSLIKSNSSLSPSYEDLLLKIKTLEQERASLLTVIRLLREESEMKLDRTNDETSNVWEQVTYKKGDQQQKFD